MLREIVANKSGDERKLFSPSASCSQTDSLHGLTAEVKQEVEGSTLLT